MFLLSLSATSCAVQTARMQPYGCADAERRLRQMWETLQAARADPNGCVDVNGYDRCAAYRTQIEQLTYDCPDHAPSLLANALLAYDANDRVKAQQLLDAMRGLSQQYPEAAVLRARISMEEGNIPFALRVLPEQIQVFPDHAGLRETYASALFAAGDWNDARAQLDTAERLGAPAWRIDFHRGLIEESAGNSEKAREYYETAIKERPGWKVPEARLNGLRAGSTGSTTR